MPPGLKRAVIRNSGSQPTVSTKMMRPSSVVWVDEPHRLLGSIKRASTDEGSLFKGSGKW